jgi:hypothetical protein
MFVAGVRFLRVVNQGGPCLCFSEVCGVLCCPVTWAPQRPLASRAILSIVGALCSPLTLPPHAAVHVRSYANTSAAAKAKASEPEEPNALDYVQDVSTLRRSATTACYRVVACVCAESVATACMLLLLCVVLTGQNGKCSTC